MRWRNLRIAVRLGLGIGLLLAIGAVAMVWILVKNYETESDFAAFANGYEKTVLLRKIGEVNHDNMYELAQIFLSDEPNARERMEADIAAKRKANEQTILDLKAKLDSPEDEQRFAEMMDKRLDYLAARKEVTTKLDEGQHDFARELLNTRFSQSAGAYREVLDRFVAAERSSVEAARENAVAATMASRIAITVGSFVALIAAGIVGSILVRSITLPTQRAVRIAEAISTGHLESEIVVDRTDEIGKLILAMQTMQENLQKRARSDIESMRAMTSVKQALDVASTNVMMIDAQGVIRYVNQALVAGFAAAAADLRVVLPSFAATELIGQTIDVFGVGVCATLTGLVEASTAKQDQLTIGIRSFVVTATPIRADHERIGAVLEWDDKTAEFAAQDEIGSLVAEASRGEFSRRIDVVRQQGFLLHLSQGVNQLMDKSASGLDDVSRILAALAQGDLTQEITQDYEGTYGRLKDDVNQTVSNLRVTVGEIRIATDSIHSAASGIAQGNGDLSRRTEAQAATLQETASTMEELTATVRQNANNAHYANQLAIGASDIAAKGGSVVAEVVQTMDSITDSSKRIADILGVIDGIAFQTNILALNAAVEAARAGEQGRGFAVVAAEVRSLAQRSAQAAKEIKGLIADSVTKVDTGSKLVGEAGRTMEGIVLAVKRVTDIMGEISAATAEQSSGIEQVNQAISQMDQATQQNSALVEEAAAAADSMEQQAHKLSESVATFRIPHHERCAPVGKPVQDEKPLPSRLAVTTPIVANRQAPVVPTPVKARASKKTARPVALAAHVADDWREF